MQIRRGEIYYANLEPVVGSEQGGERPVLIVQNDTGNRFSPTTIIAPITSRTTKKALFPTHIRISADCLVKDSVVLLEQIRVIDNKRINGRCIGILCPETMEKIDRAIAVSLALEV